MKKTLMLLFILTNLALSQNLIQRNKLSSDFIQLVSILEQTHPDPYTPFGGRMQFHKKSNELLRRIPSEGMSESDFYFFINGFTSKLNDAHTFVEYPVKTGTESTSVCPLQFGVASDGIFVKKAQQSYANLIGCKLSAVNNISVDKLLEKITIFEPCENIFGAYLSLTKYFSKQNLSNRIIANLKNELRFSFTDGKGEKIELNVPFIPENSIKEWEEKEKAKEAVPLTKILFNFDYLDKEKKTARFEFNSTYSREVIEIMKSMRMDYKPTLKMLLDRYSFIKAKLKNLEDSISCIPSLTEFFYNILVEMNKNKSEFLVVDLRENGGGWFPITTPTLYMLFGDKYFEFNTNAEYNTRISELWLAKYKITIDEFNKGNNTSFRLGEYRFGKFMGIDTTKTIKERRDHFVQELENSKRSGAELLKKQNGEAIYTPKIIIITSPATFSAAFQYLYFLKEIGNAVVVGVSPRQAGNSGMETTPFTLTNSGLRGSVSNSYQLLYPDNKEKGKLLEPDFPMNCALFSKYNYSPDAEIRYVIDLIKQSKIKK